MPPHTEFFAEDGSEVLLPFGGPRGRGALRQDPPIVRDLYVSLEDLFHGCTKKIKISRRVGALGVQGVDFGVSSALGVGHWGFGNSSVPGACHREGSAPNPAGPKPVFSPLSLARGIQHGRPCGR